VSLTILSIFSEGHVPKGYSLGNLFTRLLSNCTSEGQINSGTLLGPPMLKPSIHDLVMSIQQLGGSLSDSRPTNFLLGLSAIARTREAPEERAETGGATGLSDGHPIRARRSYSESLDLGACSTYELNNVPRFFRLAVGGPSVHELPAFLQSVAATVSLLRLVADDMR
jgi:hypothetical protein